MVSGTFGSSSSPQEPEEPTVPAHTTVPDTTDVTPTDPIGPGSGEIVGGVQPNLSLAGDIAAAVITPVADAVAETLTDKAEELVAKGLHSLAAEIEQVAEKIDHRLIGGIDVTPFNK